MHANIFVVCVRVIVVVKSGISSIVSDVVTLSVTSAELCGIVLLDVSKPMLKR